MSVSTCYSTRWASRAAVAAISPPPTTRTHSFSMQIFASPPTLNITYQLEFMALTISSHIGALLKCAGCFFIISCGCGVNWDPSHWPLVFNARPVIIIASRAYEILLESRGLFPCRTEEEVRRRRKLLPGFGIPPDFFLSMFFRIISILWDSHTLLRGPLTFWIAKEFQGWIKWVALAGKYRISVLIASAARSKSVFKLCPLLLSMYSIRRRLWGSSLISLRSCSHSGFSCVSIHPFGPVRYETPSIMQSRLGALLQ